MWLDRAESARQSRFLAVNRFGMTMRAWVVELSDVTDITARGGMRHRYCAWESRSVLGMLPKAIPGPAPISLHRRGVLGFPLHGGNSPEVLGGKARKSSQSSSLKSGGSK